MVFPVNPVIELLNIPVPVPSVVLFPDVVGFCEVLQHTPLTVMDEPPSLGIFPCAVAELQLMAEAETVCMVAVVGEVLKLRMLP